MRVVALLLGFLLFNSCGGNAPRSSGESRKSLRIPNGLVLRREISGRVLGYELKRPSGVAISATGDIYISDTGNHRLIRMDRDLTPVRDYGGYGVGVGKFQNPEDLVIDRGLNLYVLDSGNRRVVQLDANLNYVDDFDAEDDADEIMSTLGKLSGVQVSSLGEITLADYDNSRLIRMDNFRRFSRYVGDFGYGAGALLNPLGVAQDGEGKLYVADGGNGRIAVYDDYGNYIFQFGQDHLRQPSAVTVSKDNNIWVADRESDALLVFSPDGRMLFTAGGSGRDEMRFSDIEALVVTPTGELFVADSGNDRIMIYRITYEED